MSLQNNLTFRLVFKVICRSFAFLLFISCGNENNKREVTSPQLSEKLININKKIVSKESEEIEGYIKRHNWQMISTGTGLRYMIYQKAEGIKTESKKKVTLNYSLNLLDGTLCYSSAPETPLQFTIGNAEVPKGLEEGILLMKSGEKARFILPAHLGYGFHGDDNKIPHDATLVYDVELLKIEN